MKKALLLFFVFILLLGLMEISQAADLAENLAGKILLQVEENGEAWYVSPDDHYRYYLGRPADAFKVMRNLGLGISEENIKQIPIGMAKYTTMDSDQDGLPDTLEQAIGTAVDKIDTDNDGYSDKDEVENWYNPNGAEKMPTNSSLINNVKGKIILQAEKNGEAWYVSPSKLKRYYLGRPADAFEIMRNHGLGVSNTNLEKMSNVAYSKEFSSSQSGEYYQSNVSGSLIYRTDCGYIDCFDDKFQNCTPGYSMEYDFMGASQYFKIIGSKNGRCTMEMKYTSLPPNEAWVGKTMTCNCNDSLSFFNSFSTALNNVTEGNTANCQGELFDLLFENVTNTQNTSTASCFDSDGGEKFYEKGYAEITQGESSGLTKVDDECAGEHTLVEGICRDGSPYPETHYCENGCSDGVCLQ
ncbi:MAG TPA: thrombospondin type 3 repeat-containing protein [Patescibacteria group bacterium]|nr:thrombospondin type 3 repeat-containing protein [Patescibacteria group bacterium]